MILSLVEEKNNLVRECIIFIERLRKVGGINNRIIKVKLSNSENIYYTYNSFDKFMLVDKDTLAMDWFCRNNYVKISNIDEIWLGNEPLYYYGKERFYENRVEGKLYNKQIQIMFNLSFDISKKYNFERFVYMDLKEMEELIESRKSKSL